jgi:HTH-type transcriptional regulator/antitoxin HigA
MNKKRTLANDLIPGSTIHPGELLRDELDARDIKHVDMAKTLGIAKNVMSEIINGKRNITPTMAVKLEDALGIKAEFWMRYQVNYEIDKIRIRNKEAVKRSNLSEKKKKQLIFA